VLYNQLFAIDGTGRCPLKQFAFEERPDGGDEAEGGCIAIGVRLGGRMKTWCMWPILILAR